MEKVYYYNRNGALQLTFGEAPYYMRLGTGAFKDQSWAYDDQFGLMKNFRRDQSSYPFSVVITSDDLADYDRLCDIFNDDIIANSPGYFLINGWKLSCYVVKAEHEFYGRKDRVISFEAISEDSTWIRKSTRVLSGESAGESETDYGRDYTEGLIEAGSDTAPYLFRQSPQFSNGYNNETDTLVGGSVAWNQQAKQFIVNGSTFTVDGTVVTVAHNGESRTFFGVGVSDGVTYSYKPLANHKYFWSVNVTNITVSNLRFIAFANGFSEQGAVIGFNTTGVHQGISKGVGNTTLYFNANTAEPSTSTGDTFTFKDMMLIDLTAMFGSTIADYIYSLEQANAGAGVAWFRKLFPKPYYAYNAGELLSVSGVSAHVMRDADNNVVGNYALDSTLTLRGIPKLSNGKLYYDGDEYKSDGSVERRYGIVDMGTLNWNAQGAENCFYTTGIASVAKAPTDGNKPNLVCDGYTYHYVGYGQLADKEYRIDGNANNLYIGIKNTACSTSAEMKSALSGVYLVYELATPTEETAEPYTNPQVVDESGTEEYVSTSIVPVGHQTAYGLQAALRGYNYGYSLAGTHIAPINLPGSENGYEVTFYGPIVNPIIYINNHPIKVFIEVESGQRLRITSNGSEKTIKLLSQTGQETDAFIYRDKENSPFVSLGSYSEITFGEIRFDFTTIERRSEPTWT